MPNDFHFLRPWWFLVTPFLLGIVFLLNRQSTGTVSWRAVCESHLLPHLLIGKEQRSSSVPWILLGMGWVLAVLALAGPTWSKQPQPVLRAQSGLVLVLDLSQSMDAQDIRPSRLTRAKHKVRDILKRRKEGQTALVVFAEEPFVVSPLTNDAATINSMVPTLSTELMPVHGSRLDLALETADQLLSQSGISSGEILVITDGAEESQAWEAADRLRTKGRRVSILAVGTADGAPIPVKPGGFLKDRSGAIVMPKLDASSLEALARTGGGQFVQLQNDDSDIESLLTFHVDHATTKESAPVTRTTDLWNEEGPWVVMALIVLALPAFRRGWVGIVLLAITSLPAPASAWTWEDLWLRSDQQGARQLEKGKPKEAAELFSDPSWKGVANYRAGDYEQALKSFSKGDSPDSHFNRGNALARLGKFQEALAAYDKALSEQPNHEDAAFNAKLIRDLMKQQSSQRQSQQGQNQQSSSANQETKESEGSQSPQSSKVDQQYSDQGSQQAKGKEEGSLDNARKREGPDNEFQPEVTQRDPEDSHSAAQTQARQQSQEKASKEWANPAQQQEPLPGEGAQPFSQMAQSRPQSQKEEERRQATTQWLRQIPDDPGGLLRRKFRLEHQRRQGTNRQVERPW